MTIDEKTKAHCIRRIMLARMRILSDNGFFGLLLMHLKFALDYGVGTAATDGERVFFSPEFMDNINDDELVFILKHEIMHIVLRHSIRAGSRDNDLYNIAADIVVNSNIMLQADGDPEAVTLRKYGESMHKAPDGLEGYRYTTEEIYEQLLRKAPEEYLKSELTDDHSRWGTCYSDEIGSIWQSRIRDALEASKGKVGDLSEGMQREIDQYLNPKIDWRSVLNDFIQEEITDYSFSPPDRRFADCPFFLPDYNDSETMVRDVLFMIDTSSSMDDDDVSVVYSEIQNAIEQFDGKLSGWLGFFDTEVYKPVCFTDQRSFETIRPLGKGGTSFSAVFDYVAKEMDRGEIACIIILTDGLSLFPDEEVSEGIPVLWILNNRFVVPPWGRTVVIE